MDIRHRRLAVLGLILAVATAHPSSGATITKFFTGVLHCASSCTPASAATAFLENVPFTGSYSYDDAVVPTSGDPSTFENYGTGVNLSIDIGAGVYTATGTNWGLEIQRHHSNPNISFQDEVFFLGTPTFGGTGTGTFAPFAPGVPQSLIHFVDVTAADILPNTLIANWPQTVAAWSSGFAGVEFFIMDQGTPVGYRGKFLTLADAAVLGDPTIVGTASPGVTVGAGSLHDSAVVNGRTNPVAGATVDFRLYGPNDPACANPPAFASLGVSYPAGGGSVDSLTFPPSLPGVYRWVASYSGDVNNNPAASVCGDPNQTVTVSALPIAQVPALGLLGLTLLALGLAMAGGLRLRPRRPAR